MTRRDLDFDAATLRAELDGRWPDGQGARRATTDETHRLALVHPQYDGFVTLHLTARTDLDGVFLVPEGTLDAVLTAHHRIGPLARGQVLPIDLELHPGAARDRVRDGWIRFVDASGTVISPGVRVTIATHPTLDCVLAGEVDGPFEEAGAVAEAVDDLLAGRGSVRQLAQRVRAVEAGDPDPGWGRRGLGWGRRR